ncbi:VWA domain-containing protein, partial [Aestuariibacter sp. AA17]
MIDFNAFHFLRPGWLIGFIPLAIGAYVLFHKRVSSKGWMNILPPHLYQHLVISNTSSHTQNPTWILFTVAGTLTLLALAGPTWKQLPQPVYNVNSATVIVMDMSLSMRATDLKPDRLTRAKYKAIDVVNEINEGEIGLVAYAGDAFVVSPLTTDVGNLVNLIPSLSPEIMPIKGSHTFSGIEKALLLLQNSGFKQGHILLVTDGVSQKEMSSIVPLIRSSNVVLSVLSVGTKDGAPITLASGELLKNRQGGIVIPSLNTDPMQQLAKIGRGVHTQLTVNNEDVRQVTNRAMQESRAGENFEQSDAPLSGDKWEETGPYLLLVVIPLVAYFFRRGIIFVLAGILFVPIYTPPAHADWWDNLWQNQDQRGKRAFEREAFGDASNLFDNPEWKAASLYRDEKYGEAVSVLEHLNTPNAHYNRGNALAKLGRYDEAIDAYEQALKLESEHVKARENKALLEQLKS